jgi:hypothetical protein
MRRHSYDAERSAIGSRMSGCKRFSCPLRHVACEKEKAKSMVEKGPGLGAPRKSLSDLV